MKIGHCRQKFGDYLRSGTKFYHKHGNVKLKISSNPQVHLFLIDRGHVIAADCQSHGSQLHSWYSSVSAALLQMDYYLALVPQKAAEGVSTSSLFWDSDSRGGMTTALAPENAAELNRAVI